MSFNCSLVPPAMLEFCESTNAAQTAYEENLSSSNGDTDNFFLIWGSSLVFFMHAGFAMLSAGAVRTKNTKNILLSIVMDLTVCALGWFFLGFAFAFGEDLSQFIGTTKYVGLIDPSEFSFWLFQYCFAATAATIVSGAISERARFETYLATSAFMSCWVYPVVVHWVWGGGFLTLGNRDGIMGTGVVDFAGCGPVHMVGGIAGMVAAKIMGPRVGRFDPTTRAAIPIPGHSSPLAALGVFILWVGWLGFNCGSVLVLSGGGGVVASRAGVMTVLSSATGALSSMLLAHFLSKERDFDLTMCLNGALAGLVSITGCCGFVEMWAAVVIGIIGGIVYVLGSKFLLHVLKIDDPLDATPVHFFCGIWGILAGAFFVNPELLVGLFTPDLGEAPREVPAGIVYGGGTYKTMYDDGTSIDGGVGTGQLIGAACTEIAVVLAWVVGWTLPWFAFWHKFGLLRIDASMEEIGIDASAHGGAAYPEAMEKS